MKDAATHYRDNVGDLFIETMTGRFFYFEHPEFDIYEIAHSLSMQTRFTGHCRKFYSIAEHSILVSHLVEELGLGDPFEGLMHEGTEAYLNDLNAPAKARLPDYRTLEHLLEAPFRRWAGLPGDRNSKGIKKADWLALFIEADQLMTTRGARWPGPPGLRDEALALRWGKLMLYDIQQANLAFLSRYFWLKGIRDKQPETMLG